MASRMSELTVQVHLDIDLNGEPVTRVLSMPATMELPERRYQPGMTVHLHLDAAKLAKALLPELLPLLHAQQQTDTVTRRSI